jgi:multidrug efflux pump subunit AcrA (membrane-fusion protein)
MGFLKPHIDSAGFRSRPGPRGSLARGKLLLGILLLALLGGAAWLWMPGRDTTRTDFISSPVQRKKMRVTFLEHGVVEAASSKDIICRVRNRGRPFATTIKWLIEEGTPVERGAIVARLDSTSFEEDLHAEEINLQKARSDWIQAEEDFKILASQNESDLLAARIALEIAALDLNKYLHGDYEQLKKEIASRLVMAESDVDLWVDRVAWAARMVKKGFLTNSQARAEQAGFLGAQLAMESAREARRVFYRYTDRQTRLDLQSKAAQAARSLARVRSHAFAKTRRASHDRLAKKSILEAEEKLCDDLEDQIRNCTLRAPHSGVVVYHSSTQARYGSGSRSALIAEGEPVREGQVLMEIPDLSRMIVETQAHEAMLAHVYAEVREPTGFSVSIQAALLANFDTFSLLLAQSALGELHDWLQPLDYRVVSPGQPVLIRVHAWTDHVLHGQVKRIASVPSLWEIGLTETHVFPVQVAVEESAAEIKPGMTADVTFLGDETDGEVLCIPAEAVSGPIKRGPAKCTVLTSSGTEEREIVVGLTSDTDVEIRSGLEAGERVVLNPESNAQESVIRGP